MGPVVLILFLLGTTVWAGTGEDTAYQPCTAGNPSGKVHLEIRPEIELLAGVLSQTSWMQKRGPQGEGNQYFGALKAFFASYQEHPAIQMAEQLTQKGFTYDAPPNFILHLGPLPDLEPVNGYSEYLLQRADGTANLEAFRQALMQLAAESNFGEFYRQQRPYLQKTLEAAVQGFEGEQAVAWLEEFYGSKYDDYYIIFAPAFFPGGGYGGIDVTKADGTKQIYQIIRENGKSTGEPNFGSVTRILPTAIHEWGHSIVNPALDQSMEKLKVLQPLYEPVKSLMTRGQQAYGNVQSFLHEQVLRAAGVIAIGDTNGLQAMENQIADENQKGFYLTRFTVDQLQHYRKNRNKYPRFIDFVPTLLESYRANLPVLRENAGEEMCSEAEILAVINKWHRELNGSSTRFPLLGPVYLASLLDPAPYKIVQELKVEGLTPVQKVSVLAEWIGANMVHTQSLAQFKELPGNDVWGEFDGKPTYKSSLPGEMIAMRELTGKVTEKCTSLAWFNAVMFGTLGVEPGNVVFLRSSNHTIALIKLGERFYYLDNLAVKFVNSQVQQRYGQNEYIGVYNGRFAVKQTFKLDDPAFYNSQKTLEELLVEFEGFDAESAIFDAILPRCKNRPELIAEVFGKTSLGISKVAALTRYAYYSLKVKRPELYLKAALRMPLVIDSAKQLDSTRAVFDWVQSNVQPGSIFEKEPDRLMPPEDVVLFKKGSPMDKAFLTWALLKLKGQDSWLVIGVRNAYIELENQIYDVEGFRVVERIKEPVRFRLKL